VDALLVAREHEITQESAGASVESRLVWIFGSPRSGSSWLLRLLAARREVTAVNESYLGVHLVPVGATPAEGEYFAHGPRAEDPGYFFAARYQPTIRPLLRELVLTGLENQARELAGGEPVGWIAIKEPNGSHAADTIVSIVPGSRMIFLLRDGRDVVDSLLDAMLTGDSWWKQEDHPGASRPQPNRLEFVRQQSVRWVERTIATQRAFESLPGERRLLVRYERLLADTPRELTRVYEWLDLEVSPRKLEATVDGSSFDAAPAARRGPGRDMRAATPGLWRQNLDATEQALMHEIMGDKLAELGYEVGR